MGTLFGIVFQAVEYLFGAILPLKNKIHRGFPFLVKRNRGIFNFIQWWLSRCFFLNICSVHLHDVNPFCTPRLRLILAPLGSEYFCCTDLVPVLVRPMMKTAWVSVGLGKCCDQQNMQVFLLFLFQVIRNIFRCNLSKTLFHLMQNSGKSLQYEPQELSRTNFCVQTKSGRASLCPLGLYLPQLSYSDER